MGPSTQPWGTPEGKETGGDTITESYLRYIAETSIDGSHREN